MKEKTKKKLKKLKDKTEEEFGNYLTNDRIKYGLIGMGFWFLVERLLHWGW